MGIIKLDFTNLYNFFKNFYIQKQSKMVGDISE